MPKEQKNFSMIHGLSHLRPIRSIVTRDVYAYLVDNAERKNNKISLTSGNRLLLLEELGIVKQQLTKALKELIKYNFIAEKHDNYYINPKYVWKGRDIHRDKLLDHVSNMLIKEDTQIKYEDLLESSKFFR